MISIDELFAEPFEPAWMVKQKQATEYEAKHRWEEWNKVLKEKADLEWKLEAEKSHQRIMKNCIGVWRII